MTSTMFTREDAAEYLKVSTRTIDRMSLPKVKLGRATRYLMSDIEAHIASHRQEPIPAITKPIQVNTRKAQLQNHRKQPKGNEWRLRLAAHIS